MRKLLFLVPSAVGALFLTGCDDDTYRERTVVYDNRPAVYGGYASDDDFYYVSRRPYSRSYGQLYLRDGRYYYSRGGSYHVYVRPGGHHHHRGDHRFADRDRRDWDRDRDRDNDGRRSRGSYEYARVERGDRDRNWERARVQQQGVTVRDREVSYIGARDRGENRQRRVEDRSERREERMAAGGGIQVRDNQRGRQPRAEQAVYRQEQGQDGERRRKRDREDREE